MNIKETFIKNLEFISRHEEDFKIVRDKVVNVCKNPKIEEEYCDGICQKCIHNSREKVDLLVIDSYDGSEHHYRFKGSKNNINNGTNITTQKAMYRELKYFDDNLIGQEAKEDLEYYEKIKELNEYANEFFKKICKHCFKTLHSKILPIKFHMFGISFKDLVKEDQLGGQFLQQGNQNVINIYHCYDRNIKEIESTIRHECIHYGLSMENCECGDNTGVFWALAKIYDAGAYVEMNDEQKKIYNLFFQLYDDNKDNLDFAITTTGSTNKTTIQSRNKLIAILDSSNDPDIIKNSLKE